MDQLLISKRINIFALFLIVSAACFNQAAFAKEPASADKNPLLSKTRQLTFAGRRSGEGYFSADGTKLIFQSEREPGNPFFQIYLLDLETGDEQRISPGIGKTTCAWIAPDNQHVLFASTQLDPLAKQKQKDELKLRAEGKQKRYSWDYDPTYDIIEYDLKTKKYRQLSDETGYDAEGSYSPDGKLIAFASNRGAYDRKLSKEEQEKLKHDPSVFMEIYLMNADGTNVRQLTDTFGYDGGPFFSPDGKRICWRRFTEDGATAEIMTMNIDGSDVKQLTNWHVMSWAPFYHPSGKYIIFTTNRHGFANFELYLVDVDGKSAPVRVTDSAGFDGLPVFTPDGNALVWTSNRTENKQSQLFRADWNHELALELLEQSSADNTKLSSAEVLGSAKESAMQAASGFQPADIARHVAFLCREELEGRLTGTEGEKLATAYIAAYFDELGLEPAGDKGTWFQNFEFTAGIKLGEKNSLALGDKSYEINKQWRPVSFSASGKFTADSIAFAGYGLVAPASKDFEEYDSYVHLDVKDKWVVVFRFLPESASPELRQHWGRFSSLRYKAMVARDKGAKGLIVVSGPNSKVKNQLIKLRNDGSLSGTSIPVISASDEVVDSWLKKSAATHPGEKRLTLKAWQDRLDPAKPQMGFVLDQIKLTANIDITQVKRTGRNVIGRLTAEIKQKQPALLVGAHVDHLGRGGSSSSLAKEDEQEQIHFGADDNASGTAAMLEIAEYLSAMKKKDQLPLKRDVLFVAWSGEELGLYGSSHFVKSLKAAMAHHAHGSHDDAAHLKLPGHKKAGKKSPHQPAKHVHDSHSQSSLNLLISACINMDMVGRFDKALVLQGIGSSSIWKREIEKRNIAVGLPITLQNDSYLPTDASSFFMNGVPILSAFTGNHTDYHTPRDTPEKLNYEAAAKIAKLMGLIARGLAISEKNPDYIAQEKPEQQRRANLRAYLGTIPDYAAADVKGLKLSGVGKGGPAEKAGVKGGDLIVELAGKKIENIYDYTYAIEAIKIGQKTKIVVLRKGKRITLDLVPGSRE